MYRIVMAVATPIVRWWGRLDVVGLHLLPKSGPTVLMVNHDSHWDPVVIGVAAPTRQLRALAKASLWKNPVEDAPSWERRAPARRPRGGHHYRPEYPRIHHNR